MRISDHKKRLTFSSLSLFSPHFTYLLFLSSRIAVPSGHSVAPTYVTTIDLDVDIGADAVDYNAIANQESLSGLETEMRKLEGVVGEIVNEMEYLKKREIKMKDTNGEYLSSSLLFSRSSLLVLSISVPSEATFETSTDFSLSS